jgi:uncharacterized protein YdaU (DUF1376 family)
MSARPWYRRYGSDFIAGTLGLTLEEKGAYSLILDLIYDHGGPIADDPRYIAGVCGCSVRKWNAIRATLVKAGKIEVGDGTISNSRAIFELENDAKTTRKLSENGRTGGNKRAENEAARKENNGLAEAGLKHRAPVQNPESREEGKPSSSSGDKSPSLRARDVKAAFERFTAAYPKREGTDPSKPAFDKFAAAVKSGTDPAAIIAGAVAYAAEQAGLGKVGTQFVKQRVAWLNQRLWEDYRPPPPEKPPDPDAGRPPGAPSTEEILARTQRSRQANARENPDPENLRDGPGVHREGEAGGGQRSVSGDQAGHGGVEPLGDLFPPHLRLVAGGHAAG